MTVLVSIVHLQLLILCICCMTPCHWLLSHVLLSHTQPPLASLERMTGAGASSSSTAFSSSASAAAAAASSSSTRTTSAAAAAAASGSLGALVPFLMQRLDLLDKVKIDAVQRRIKILLADVDALLAARLRVSTAVDASSSSSAATGAGAGAGAAGGVDASIGANGKGAAAHEMRVRDLHAALLRWDAAAQQLPAVIARLRSLAALHEQSAHAVTRLEACEWQIRGAEQLLQTDAQLMAQV